MRNDATDRRAPRRAVAVAYHAVMPRGHVDDDVPIGAHGPRRVAPRAGQVGRYRTRQRRQLGQRRVRDREVDSRLSNVYSADETEVSRPAGDMSSSRRSRVR